MGKICETCGSEMTDTKTPQTGVINDEELPVIVVTSLCPQCQRQDANIILTGPIKIKGMPVKQV